MNSPNYMYDVIFHVLSSPSVWLATLLCTCLCLLPYMLVEYVNTAVWPTLFDGNDNDVQQNNRGNINNNVDSVPDSVDDSNIVNGISIIGSAAVKRKHNGESRIESKNNDTSYAFINPGYVADTAESTRL